EVAKTALPARTAALKNSDLRPYAAKALADLGALEVLAKALDDRDEDIRIEAVVALQTLRKRAVPALRGALKDKSADVKMNTANVLGKLGEEAAEAAGDLAALLTDKNDDVRYQAAKALEAIGPAAKAALPQLNAAKDDKTE